VTAGEDRDPRASAWYARHMNDGEAITRLIHLYAERLDEGDLEAVAALFTHATLRSNHRPEGRRGRDAALRLYQDTLVLYDGKPSTKHVTTNVVVDLEPDAPLASARSYFTVFQARPELPLQAIIAGRYHDRFEKVEHRWRFTDRLILVDLLGDLRCHLKTPLPAA
jgi:3-phenylpropionate/cinnamic acid dioxygenase small subunit